jgi:hypothetical protein
MKKNKHIFLLKPIILIFALIVIELLFTILIHSLFPKLNMKNGVQLAIDISLITAIIIGNKYLFKEENEKASIKSMFSSLTIFLIFITAFIWILITPIFIYPFNFNSLTLKFCFEKVIIPANIFSISTFYISYRALLITPVLEELLFRKLILSKLYIKYGYFVSILITSFLFSISHLDVNNFLIFFIGSIFLCFIFLKTNNILYSILLHIFMNIITFVLC